MFLSSWLCHLKIISYGVRLCWSWSSSPFRMGLTIPTLLIWKETESRWEENNTTTNRKSSKPCLKELKVPENGVVISDSSLCLSQDDLCHSCVHSNCWRLLGLVLECLEPTAHLSRENRMSQEQTLASSFFFYVVIYILILRLNLLQLLAS